MPRGCSAERNSSRHERRWGWRRRIMTKRGVTNTEQPIVKDLLILQHQWGQTAREGEEHVHIARGEQ